LSSEIVSLVYVLTLFVGDNVFVVVTVSQSFVSLLQRPFRVLRPVRRTLVGLVSNPSFVSG